MSKKLVAIWAEDENRLIGSNQKMPWHLPKELQHFKKTTMGEAILMGRVTFDGMKRRLLPGRETLILTRDQSFQVLGARVFHSTDEVLTWYHQQDKTLFITGGSHVYAAFKDVYDELIVTKIHACFEGDTYFPSDINLDDYQKVSEVFYDKDDGNPYAFTVLHYIRKVRE